MPCFKGLAVSIHTPDGPLAEHSIQKQSRLNRISSYIPVPPAKVPDGSTTGKPEQSTFAVSITLLTPGLNVPYSTPKPTEADPYPRPRVVGGLPGYAKHSPTPPAPVPPYIPRTTSPNETVAAYIYFDGRAKEEVATLLRRGEETWVNSRWVSVPASEGGGLAEREFLFREVGLERWLNGLDLEGKDKAERIARRQRRLDKKKQKRKEQMVDKSGSDSEDAKRLDRNGVLRYGGEDGSPVEEVSNDDDMLSSSDSEDEPPEPEAAGQIKVALFRVLASGEIKRGEYSPQFDAHDDDDGMGENGNADGGDAEIDHTTSFAQPKTLDPKSISTQTVTGLDPTDRPYAVFTFFYRGEKQLQKMGILKPTEVSSSARPEGRKRSGTDFSKLGPLKSQGTVGFSGYRDTANGKKKASQKKDDDAMDSDVDEDDDDKLPSQAEDEATKQENGNDLLSPEDARRQGEIADGVQKIKLKRAHSAEPPEEISATRKSPHLSNEDSPTPQSVNSMTANAGTPPSAASPPAPDGGETVSSPFKRHRATMSGLDDSTFGQLGAPLQELPNAAATTSNPRDDDLTTTEPTIKAQPDIKLEPAKDDSDEEL